MCVCVCVPSSLVSDIFYSVCVYVPSLVSDIFYSVCVCVCVCVCVSVCVREACTCTLCELKTLRKVMQVEQS